MFRNLFSAFAVLCVFVFLSSTTLAQKTNPSTTVPGQHVTITGKNFKSQSPIHFGDSPEAFDKMWRSVQGDDYQPNEHDAVPIIAGGAEKPTNKQIEVILKIYTKLFKNTYFELDKLGLKPIKGMVLRSS